LIRYKRLKVSSLRKDLEEGQFWYRNVA
jgi:hypothetical protein